MTHLEQANAYIIYRVLVRLNEQAVEAHRYGRVADAFAISKLIGRLEYGFFGSVGFELWLKEPT